VECIDPKTGEPVDLEEKGELVLTTLTKEGMPILRYRTRDLSYLYDDVSCDCGRTHIRHAPIKGRTDDMLIIRGTNIYPGQIEEALLSHPEIGGTWRMIIETIGDMDRLLIQVETKRDVPPALLEKLKAEVTNTVQVITALTPAVEIHPPDTLPSDGIKAQRVIDKRRDHATA
jgi:phenylacetate-CoA ligase